MQNKTKINFFNLLVITVNTPTDENQIERKEEFYEQLEEVYDKLPRNDIIRRLERGNT